MELNRNFQNIVQASEEEKFLFILPSATDVRTLKDLALIGWCSFKVWLPYSNLPIQNVQKGSATMCATASIFVISSEIINLVFCVNTLDIIMNQPCAVPTISCGCQDETDLRTF